MTTTQTETKTEPADNATARDASVLNGVTATTPKRTPSRATRAADKTAKATTPKATAKATAPKAAPKAEPKAAPAPAPEPKVDMRAAKQEIARIAVQAMADAIQRANGLKKTGYLAAFSGDEALQIVSQLSHHFPCGREGDERWWPANLPRPNRSDWA